MTKDEYVHPDKISEAAKRQYPAPAISSFQDPFGSFKCIDHAAYAQACHDTYELRCIATLKDA